MIMSTNDTYTQKEIHKQNIYAKKVKVTWRSWSYEYQGYTKLTVWTLKKQKQNSYIKIKVKWMSRSH